MEVLWIEGDGAGFAHARAVRRGVFVEEQGFSAIGEFDDVDRTSLHVVGFEEGVPVCTGRMFEETPGVKHVGRVAVLSRKRGSGLGLAMMELFAEKAREQGAKKIVLSAQADKEGFYERAGYVSTGKKTLDEGVPHVEMMLEL